MIRVWVIASAMLCAVLALTACTAAGESDPDPAAQVIVPGKPGEPNETLSPEQAAERVTEAEPNDADFAYVEGMIVHHRQALDMSALADRHAKDKKVRALAARIGDAQQPEITAMENWLTDNGRSAPADDDHAHGGHGDMPGMATEQQMRALAEARGEAFDRMFLELMIEHHDGALVMARELQPNGSAVLVQEMADHVIATQAAEISRMRALLER